LSSREIPYLADRSIDELSLGEKKRGALAARADPGYEWADEANACPQRAVLCLG
jgi:hypothetical protein